MSFTAYLSERGHRGDLVLAKVVDPHGNTVWERGGTAKLSEAEDNAAAEAARKEQERQWLASLAAMGFDASVYDALAGEVGPGNQKLMALLAEMVRLADALKSEMQPAGNAQAFAESRSWRRPLTVSDVTPARSSRRGRAAGYPVTVGGR